MVRVVIAWFVVLIEDSGCSLAPLLALIPKYPSEATAGLSLCEFGVRLDQRADDFHGVVFGVKIRDGRDAPTHSLGRPAAHEHRQATESRSSLGCGKLVG